MHLVTRLLVLLIAFGLAACRSPLSEAKGPIDQLHLLVTSVALNLDEKPGPDGVGVRVYASRRGLSEAVPITAGTLVLMYDGSLPLDQLPSLQPRRTWSYPADQLKPYTQKTSIGVSYRFAAIWGEEKPTGDRVTMVARYRGPDSRQTYSAPSSVPVSAQ
jgi:hypothetical protein